MWVHADCRFGVDDERTLLPSSEAPLQPQCAARCSSFHVMQPCPLVTPGHPPALPPPASGFSAQFRNVSVKLIHGAVGCSSLRSSVSGNTRVDLCGPQRSGSEHPAPQASLGPAFHSTQGGGPAGARLPLPLPVLYPEVDKRPTHHLACRVFKNKIAREQSRFCSSRVLCGWRLRLTSTEFSRRDRKAENVPLSPAHGRAPL